jgi:c-di-GMP-binding flagellar brake protein YcgR
MSNVDNNPCWPELHARVEVLGPWYDVWLPSLIEDRDGGLIQVAVPTAPGTIVPVVAEPGQHVTLHWVSARGAADVQCRLREVARDDLASWWVQALGLPMVRQRRAYVRAEVHMPLQLLPAPGASPLEGWAVDLSEGGVKLVTLDQRFDIGRRAIVELEIEGQAVFISGEILRVRSDEDGYATMALRFVDVHNRDADRIRRFVFNAQLRSPARQR